MTSAHDDSFREIQLSGKQLVFLFMAVVVILVGTFLMGLLVGRGVLAARGTPGSVAADQVAAEPPPPPSSASPGTSTSPVTASEKLSYAERLGSAGPAKEQLRAEAGPVRQKLRRHRDQKTLPPHPPRRRRQSRERFSSADGTRRRRFRNPGGRPARA